MISINVKWRLNIYKLEQGHEYVLADIERL